MGSVQLGLALLSNVFVITWSQYYADNQYYFYPQQYQQNYWPQRTYQAQQNVRYPAPNYLPRQPPQAIVPPLQQQQARVQAVPEKKPASQRVVSSDTNFDLPPPPPSRFLPDEERSKVLSFNKQGRPEHTASAVVPGQQRIRLITGATNASRSQNQSPPQVQIHHLQVPRVLQKSVASTPSQITHFVANTVVSTTLPSPTVQPVVTFTTPSPSTEPPHFETEATTLTTKPVSHLSTAHAGKVNPNKVFLKCCLEKKVAKSCESKCDFDKINKKALTSMFLGTDVCPQSYGLDLFACAAQENDHRTCCRGKNVHTTRAGEKCLSFCNLRPETHFQADASYLPCWAVLNDIKNCFKEAIIGGGPL